MSFPQFVCLMWPYIAAGIVAGIVLLILDGFVDHRPK